MPLPLVYNLRSVKERWTSSLVAIIGIAGTVSVFIAMLALARGFQATLVSSGQPQNAIVQQAGADSEMTSAHRTGRRPHGGGSAAGGASRGRRAGLARGGRHRGRAPARHQRRCQRADAWRVAEGTRRARQREGDVGPVLHAGPVRNRRRQARGPRVRGPRPRAQHPHRAGHVEGRRRLRRRRQRLRLGDLGRLRRPQRQLPAAQQRLPVGDGEAAIGRRLRRLRRGAAQEPAPAGAGRPRAAILRRSVAHRHARSSPCSAGWSPS